MREENVMMILDLEGYPPSFILFEDLILFEDMVFISYSNGSYVKKQPADLDGADIVVAV